MQFIDGVKINDRAALAARGFDSEEIAAWAVRAFLHMIFRDGFFHCDPHPGNLLVDERRPHRHRRLRHEQAPRRPR